MIKSGDESQLGLDRVTGWLDHVSKALQAPPWTRTVLTPSGPLHKRDPEAPSGRQNQWLNWSLGMSTDMLLVWAAVLWALSSPQRMKTGWP